MMAMSSLIASSARILLSIFILYIVLLILFVVFQRSFSYFPGNTAFVPAEWDLNELHSLPVTTSDGLSLNSWYRPQIDFPGLTIVYFQGNASHFGVRNEKIRPWLNAGYGVLLVGYRGYNGNPGKPTEEGFYKDALAALDRISMNASTAQKLVFYGESLGTGIAMQMATEYNPSAIILEAPFTSFPDVGAYHYPWLPVRLLLRDQYKSLEKIVKVHAPLLLIHGEADNVVPVALGKKLFKAANEPKKAVYIPLAGHNDLYEYGAGEIVAQFLASIKAENP